MKRHSPPEVAPRTIPEPGTSEQSGYFDGVVFLRMTTLTLWGGLAAAAAAVNLLWFGWVQLDVGPLDGPNGSEQTTLGAHMVIYGLLYTGAGLALLHGSRAHPRRMSTPWLLVGAAAIIHFLLGVPLLVGSLGEDGSLGLLVWLNPLTYAVAVPAALTLVRRRGWGLAVPRLVLAVSVVTALLVVATALNGTF